MTEHRLDWEWKDIKGKKREFGKCTVCEWESKQSTEELSTSIVQKEFNEYHKNNS